MNKMSKENDRFFLTVQTRTDVYYLTGLKQAVLHFKILIMPENDLTVINMSNMMWPN